MNKDKIFEMENPGWTIKIRSCGHYEPEPKNNPGYPQSTYYTNSVGQNIGPAPIFCTICAIKKKMQLQQSICTGMRSGNNSKKKWRTDEALSNK